MDIQLNVCTHIWINTYLDIVINGHLESMQIKQAIMFNRVTPLFMSYAEKENTSTNLG